MKATDVGSAQPADHNEKHPHVAAWGVLGANRAGRHGPKSKNRRFDAHSVRRFGLLGRGWQTHRFLPPTVARTAGNNATPREWGISARSDGLKVRPAEQGGRQS